MVEGGKSRFSLYDIPANSVWLNTRKKLSSTPRMLLLFSKTNPIPRLNGDSTKWESDEESTMVGIWSPEFSGEKNLEVAERTIKFLGVSFPVVLDMDNMIKKELGISTLPSAIVLGEDGEIIRKFEGFARTKKFIMSFANHTEKKRNEMGGEVRRELKKTYITEEESAEQKEEKSIKMRTRKQDFLYSYFSSKKRIDGGEDLLYFPKRIAFSRKIFAVSTGRGEVVILSWRFFDLIDIIGEGGKRFCDRRNCKLHEIEFRTPEGLCFSEDGKKLLVCDFDEDKVSVIDLERKGLEAEIPVPAPKDIAPQHGKFYAVSWTGKIFRIDISEMTCEEVDFEMSGETLSLDRASAILPYQNGFIVSNSGDCSIVKIENGKAGRLAGGSGEEGHKDGPAEFSRFQFPSGIGTHKDVFFIADTLNNSIRVIFDGKVATMLLRDTELKEPEDVQVIRGSVLIADTGNHRILMVDSLSLKSEEVRIEYYSPVWIDEFS